MIYLIFPGATWFFVGTALSQNGAIEQAATYDYPPAIEHLWQQNPAINNPFIYAAAELKIDDAGWVLAQFHLERKNYRKARKWLSIASLNSAEALSAYLKLMATQKDWAGVDSWLSKELYLDDLAHLKWRNALQNKTQINTVATLVKGEQCLSRIQPLATDVDSLESSHTLIEQFQQDARFTKLALCINYPLLIRPSRCHKTQPLETSDKACLLVNVAKRFNANEFSQLMIMTSDKRSYVKNGVMWLSENAAYSLMLHELAHFVNFVDEYPLRQAIAKSHCEDINSSANLVSSGHLDMPTKMKQFFLAKTCIAVGKDTYKRARGITFMEYHDVGIIPETYLKIWHQRVLDPTHQIPAYIAIQRAFEELNKPQQGHYWRTEAGRFWNASP